VPQASPGTNRVVIRHRSFRALRSIGQPKLQATSLHSMQHFSTIRLTAERIQQHHLADLVALHLDPDVSRYLGGIRSATVTEAWLALNIAHWQQYGFGLWVLKTRSTGEFAGRAGLRHIALDGADEVEIVFSFARALWGQGLASETAQALMKFARSGLHLPSLVGIVSVANAASRRVLEKSGFALERHGHYRGSEIVIYRH
jgi:RimJ/RimL family protein N-acetyltransferase